MSEEIIMINMIDETVNKIGDFADEFTFELEELDGKRASALVVALDPPDCTINHSV